MTGLERSLIKYVVSHNYWDQVSAAIVENIYNRPFISCKTPRYCSNQQAVQIADVSVPLDCEVVQKMRKLTNKGFVN